MKWLLALLVVLALAGGALAWLFFRRAPTTEWETQAVDEGELVLKVSATGSVEPLRTIQVGSQISGIVKEVRAEPDQPVRAGQVLVILDSEILEAELRDRELDLQRARLRIEQLGVEEENLKVREERLARETARVRLELEQARAQAELAQRNLKRWEAMQRQDAAAEAELDDRRLEAENAARAVKLKEEIELKVLELEARKIAADRASLAVSLKEAACAVQQAEQNLSKARKNLSYATISAPISGVVLERTVEPGQTIAAVFQAPNLFRLAEDLRVVRITAQVDEADIGRMREGLEATFEVDAFRGQLFKGKVSAVRLKNELRGNVVTYPVLVDAPNPASAEHPRGMLRPGMTAYLTFEAGRKRAVRLPAAALRFAPPVGSADKAPSEPGAAKAEPLRLRGMSATAYVPAAPGRLRPVSVRVGDTDGERYELLSNELKPGDAVVTGVRAK
jgi:HlyD family secretion protein